MSTYERYVLPADRRTWDVPASGAARFSWEYDDGRERLLALYQKGKDKQWDANTRIDWSQEIDPVRPLGIPDESLAIYGTPMWEKMSEADKGELRLHLASWQFSQFLHGEQGAMICSARIVESVPDLDAKFYATTQTIDESRHVEVYARFCEQKLGILYPINPNLKSLLDETLTDSRWDMPYLGMQVLIEGLALAAFQRIRDQAKNRLAASVNAYVMQDEARHVAFGRLALRDYYPQLSEAERDEREEFVVEACYHMRERFNQKELWENLGLPVKEAVEATMKSEQMAMFRKRLFSRIVPTVKDIGLWGSRVQKAFEDMGAIEFAEIDAEALLENDQRVAEEFDAGRFVQQSLTPAR